MKDWKTVWEEGHRYGQSLVDKFPTLFSNTYRSNIADIPMGWRPVVEELSAKIVERGFRVEVVQVKQKFGGLRYYVDGLDDSFDSGIYTLIDEAEKTCSTLCEVCGKPSGVKVTIRNWISTLCPECQAKEEQER